MNLGEPADPFRYEVELEPHRIAACRRRLDLDIEVHDHLLTGSEHPVPR